MVRQRQIRNTKEANQRSQSRSESPPKRHKRGKYVSKACGQCQRRKIKCDGNVPCRPCILNQRDCRIQAGDMRRKNPRLTGHDDSNRTVVTSESATRSSEEQPTTSDLAGQLSRIERQLNLVLSSMPHVSNRPTESGPRVDLSQRDVRNFRHVSDISNTAQAQVPAFSGESSISHTLDQIEGFLKDKNGGQNRTEHSMSCNESGTSLTAPSSPSTGSKELRTPTDIRKVMRAHGIYPLKAEWDAYMHTFYQEVHILYPFLYLPTLWGNYTNLWNCSFLPSEPELQRSKDYRIMVSQIWICIALGRCTESPRVNSKEGKESAGWSLFEAATDLIGDILGSFRACSKPVLVIQTYALMIVYLFRLDANEKAEKFLALAISHAHYLGFHRRKVVERMPVFQNEMVRRLWWCLYSLDRRLAIETGHPFLIQDVNVDTAHPRNLSDEWLTSHEDGSKMNADIESDIEGRAPDHLISPIPFLSATIRYSQVLGKIWEAIYGANMTDVVPSSSVLEYLDQLISRAQKDVRPEFCEHHQPNPEDRNRSNPLWWLIKQQMLMRIRWLSLRLLIRKPILQQKSSPTESIPGALETEITCMRMASNIIQEFRQVPQEYTPSAFPFLHSLVGSTVVALGLIIREPSFKATYGDQTLHAAISLERYCRMTWVSGKMIRTIRRLNQMASSVLGDNGAEATRSDSSPFSSQGTNMMPHQANGSASRMNFLMGNNYPRQQTAINSYTDSPFEGGAQLPRLSQSTMPLIQPQPGWSVNPGNLVTTDFDFEQMLTGDAMPGDMPSGWEPQMGEIQTEGTAGIAMGWLESLFGTDLGM
ncbi:fungal-specific transcription factor domain-containing protein [Aspergillus avenaceus]|uniref:Fungal-specific transcription factor domain-containing protein n=1 Tax=Aspergillus avenaceus TaxID=36643 RepID=A0A5N6TWB4_ASPAV|nr:fungal-specific transcription factor domain-containing protein [Aspergillus avenaceus]